MKQLCVIERLDDRVLAVTPCEDEGEAMHLAHQVDCANAKAGGDASRISVSVGEDPR